MYMCRRQDCSWPVCVCVGVVMEVTIEGSITMWSVLSLYTHKAIEVGLPTAVKRCVKKEIVNKALNRILP